MMGQDVYTPVGGEHACAENRYCRRRDFSWQRADPR